MNALRLLTPALAIGLLVLVARAEEAPQGAQPPATPSPSPAGATQKIGTYSEAHVDGPYIAMTFDDGPSAENTPRLLDILKQRNIKATFFLLGENVVQHPEIVKRILAEGHEIGNHSWDHPQLSKLSDDRVTSELTRTSDAIREACGYTPKVMRPPYGAITKRQRDWIAEKLGLSIILWSVDPLDWKRPGPSVVSRRILSGAGPGAIILSHDIHKPTVDAMPATFDALLAKGFKFVTVSELIAMNKPAPPKPEAQTSNTQKTSGEKPVRARNTKVDPTTGKPDAMTRGAAPGNSSQSVAPAGGQ
jgi:peptidoglycan/xylan/chitin deacetylase (PgdA/CDA1 family)